MNFSLTENVKLINALPPKTSDAGGFAGDTRIIDMKNFDKVVFYITNGPTGSDSKIVANAMNASTIAGSTDVAIPFKYKYCSGSDDKLADSFSDADASGLTMAGVANSSYAIEIKASDLQYNAGDDYRYIRLTATAGTAEAQDVSINAICYNVDYASKQLKVASYTS